MGLSSYATHTAVVINPLFLRKTVSVDMPFSNFFSLTPIVMGSTLDVRKTANAATSSYQHWHISPGFGKLKVKH